MIAAYETARWEDRALNDEKLRDGRKGESGRPMKKRGLNSTKETRSCRTPETPDDGLGALINSLYLGDGGGKPGIRKNTGEERGRVFGPSTVENDITHRVKNQLG